MTTNTVTDIQALQAKLAAIKEENQKLKNKQAKKNQPSLPNIPQYNTEIMLAMDDMPELFQKHSLLDKVDAGDVRAFIRFARLIPKAQSKPLNAKGRGKNLYVTNDVIQAIKQMASCFIK